MVYAHIYRLMRRRIRRRKIRRKSDKFHEIVSQELLWLLTPNLICKVRYMKALTFINLVEICALPFELWEAEIGYLTGRVNDTLVLTHLSWLLTHDRVS